MQEVQEIPVNEHINQPIVDTLCPNQGNADKSNAILLRPRFDHPSVISVRRTSKRFGFKEVGDEEDWNLYWTDFSVSLERVMDMKKYQV